MALGEISFPNLKGFLAGKHYSAIEKYLLLPIVFQIVKFCASSAAIKIF